MRISEASSVTKLTKKAIGYYVSLGLVAPTVSENGYRAFHDKDIEDLKKISVLRKLGISTDEIGEILKDKSGSALRSAAIKKELNIQSDIAKQSILKELSQGKSFGEAYLDLQSVDRRQTITDKLLNAFPGCYGRFICLHFARFLNEPIQTAKQQAAYEVILSFFDDLPPIDLPKDLEDFLTENTGVLSAEQITEMLESTKRAYEDPDAFLIKNKDIIDGYLAYRQSDEYRNSLACKLLEYVKAFNSANGYNDVFLPAMRRLSPSYAEYARQMRLADEKLSAQYPEMIPPTN